MTNSYQEKQTCNQTQYDAFVKQASDFVASTNGLYSSCKSVAIYAIADFLASQQNLKLIRK